MLPAKVYVLTGDKEIIHEVTRHENSVSSQRLRLCTIPRDLHSPVSDGTSSQARLCGGLQCVKSQELSIGLMSQDNLYITLYVKVCRMTDPARHAYIDIEQCSMSMIHINGAKGS